MQLVSDWEECHLQFNALLASSQPVFVNRVGGSDTNAICAYLAALNGGEDKLQSTLKTHSEIVERFNGFYDLDKDPGAFVSYMDKLLSIYKSSTDLLFCNRQLLSMYFSDNLHPSLVMNHIVGRDGFEMLFQLLLESGRVERCYPYNYVEKMVSHPLTLMHAFSDQLVGKKVLVVSPFAESIHLNFARRHEFFKGYQYPDFDLLTYNTPITYSGLPMHMYPHRNWFQTLDAMTQDISAMEFDIALLSCGSYAVPLGDHIATWLGKKAIYVGGVLQLMFGIIGRRYENEFFTDQINQGSFIRPVEAERFLQHVPIEPGMVKEAFGAYF